MMHTKQKLAFILAVVLAFTGVSNFSTVRASTNLSQIDEEKFINYNFPNLFNYDDKTKKETTTIPRYLYYVLLEINGNLVFSPVYVGIYEFSKDGKNQNSKITDKDHLENLDDNYHFLYNYIKGEAVSNQTKQKDFGYYTVIYDIVENEVMSLEYMGKDFLSNDFFHLEKRDSVKIIRYMESSAVVETLQEQFNINGFSKELFMGKTPITLEEYIEIYKKSVPFELWPVIPENKTVVNSTIPKLKDSILDIEDLEGLSIGYAVDYKNKTTKYMLCIYVYYPEERLEKCFDFLTGDSITEDLWDTIDLDLIKRFHMDEDNTYFDCESFNSSGDGIKIYKPDLFNDFKNVKSVRDAIDFYQKFPLNEQIDYSYFDFSDSPDVDSAWLASRPSPPPKPTPAPTPTPVPYAELSVGSKGKDVLKLKQRFLELGYFRTDKFNDSFTDKTAETVRQFEKDHGLPVDGIADSQMLNLLYSDSARKP